MDLSRLPLARFPSGDFILSHRLPPHPPSSRGHTRQPTVLQYAASGAQHGWNAGPFAAEVPSLSFPQTTFLQMQIGEVSGDSLTHLQVLLT
jgi:hypothetical protein